MEQDLRVCKVREVNDNERRFLFEIVSPKCRHFLQADSQQECHLWVQYIDKAINDALNNTSPQQQQHHQVSSLSGSVEIPINRVNEDSDSSEYNTESIDSNEVNNNSNNNAANDSALSSTMSRNVSARSFRESNDVLNDELSNKNFLITSVKGKSKLI